MQPTQIAGLRFCGGAVLPAVAATARQRCSSRQIHPIALSPAVLVGTIGTVRGLIGVEIGHIGFAVIFSFQVASKLGGYLKKCGLCVGADFMLRRLVSDINAQPTAQTSGYLKNSFAFSGSLLPRYFCQYAFTFTNSYRPNSESSRPKPESFTPPKGRRRSLLVWRLMNTLPASICWPSSQALSRLAE